MPEIIRPEQFQAPKSMAVIVHSLVRRPSCCRRHFAEVEICRDVFRREAVCGVVNGADNAIASVIGMSSCHSGRGQCLHPVQRNRKAQAGNDTEDLSFREAQ